MLEPRLFWVRVFNLQKYKNFRGETLMRKFSADFLRVAGFFIIISTCAFSAFAQDFSDRQKNNSIGEDLPASVQTDDEFDKKNELSVLGGFAPRGFSSAKKSNFGFAAVRYSRRIYTTENLALKYQIDFIPVAIINFDNEQVIQTAPTTFITRRERTTVYGIGLTPISFQLNFRRKKNVQPFIGVNTGLIYFTKIIPDNRSVLFPNRTGTQLNFASAGGGGVEFISDSGRSYTVGYKYNHLSNASRGNINPGFNQNIFYFGYTFKKW